MANANALGKLIQGGLKALEKKGGLSMEPEARMARAKEMGFDTETPWHHGTTEDIQAFRKPKDEPGPHFGTPDQANARLNDLKTFEWSGMTGERVMPVYLRAQNPLRVRDLGDQWDHGGLSYALRDSPIPRHEVEKTRDMEELRKLIQSKGYDSLVYNNIGEVPGRWELYEKLAAELPNNPSKKRIQQMHDTLDRHVQDNARDSMIPLDPSQVRSTSAAFDPKKINSRDILAGGIPVAGAVGAAQQDEEGDNPLEIQRRYARGGRIDPRELPPEPQASSPQLPATIDGMSPPIDFLGQPHGQTPGQTWGDTTPDYESQPIEERIRQLRQPGIPGAPAWGGDLSGVDRRRMVPPRPVRKADGGMIAPGNIDLHNRPRVDNGDGSFSTVRSMGTRLNGVETLLPTVSEHGTIMSDSDAIARYMRSGRHLGMFDSIDASNRYAEKLHHDQETEYKADGGEITEQQPMELPDGVSESELRAALAYLAKMQRHEEV